MCKYIAIIFAEASLIKAQNIIYRIPYIKSIDLSAKQINVLFAFHLTALKVISFHKNALCCMSSGRPINI